MTSLHEYEAWLDSLDARFAVRDGRLLSSLGAGFSVPLVQMKTEAEVLDAADRFWTSLLEGGEALPRHYLFERFHRLAFGERHSMTFDRFAHQFLVRHPEVERSDILGWRGR